ncbi:MAG: hypothetical protein ACRES9_00270 [Gammaproteobacteria bacterium]
MKRRRQSAIDEFKDSFAEVIMQLTDREANPTLLITSSFPAHKQAAVKLLGRLPEKKAKKFSKAWVEYQTLHEQKASLGMLGTFAAEITDPSRALDPEHIYEVNTLRRKEAIATIKRLLDAADR